MTAGKTSETAKTGLRQAGRKALTLIVLLTASVITAINISSCSREAPEELMKNAVEAAKSGDWDYARDYAGKAVARDEAAVDARLLLGICHHYLGDQKQAIMNIEKAVEENPNYFQAQYIYGWILCENKKFAKALSPLRKAYDLEHNHKQVLTLLVRASLEQNLEEGAGYMQRLMVRSEDQDKPEGFNALAFFQLEKANFTRADIFFQQALRQDPDNPVILQNRAVLHDAYLNQEDKALNFYRRCLKASQEAADNDRVKKILERLRTLMNRRRSGR